MIVLQKGLVRYRKLVYPAVKPKKDDDTPVDKLAKELDYETPEKIMAQIRLYFGGRIPLDPATTKKNPTGARFFFTPEENGLALSWKSRGVFTNPPYGTPLKLWLQKIADTADDYPKMPILALLPGSRWEQVYWQQCVLARSNAQCYVRKRVSFIRPKTGEKAKGNPYASILYGFNVDEHRFLSCFNSLGLCLHSIPLRELPQCAGAVRYSDEDLLERKVRKVS